jgi:phage-related protein
MKRFNFVNKAAQKAFMGLPAAIRTQFGADIYAIQHNQRCFSDCEDVSSSVGKGAFELKENGSPAYRAIYCAKYLNTVYILHAFAKTTNGVDRQAMATAAMRYKILASLNAEEARKQKVGKRISSK